MRRNRRGPGGSGSASFLSRALKCNEADLKTAFVGLGLTVPSSPNDKPVYVEIGSEVWWLNSDSRGGLWINGRDKKPGETIGAATAAPAETSESAGGESLAAAEAAPAAEVAPAAASVAAPGAVLAGVRLLLKETKTGSIAGKVERLAEELGKSADDFTATLVGAGLKLPEKAREKPVFVEHAGEIFWLNKNAKGELWLNAKASKFAGESDAKSEGDASAAEGAAGEGDKKPRRPRTRKKTE
jgi:hypothetical protein